jgi:cobalt/nickel transport system permease protein
MMAIDSAALHAVSGPAMHIPDGFLSTPVALAAWVVTGVMVAFAARRAERQLNERAVPLMGVMAAFIFAAQMMNFPVAGGTSGHLLGGALAVALLGPWAAVIVMTAVIGLQALLFQDGGLVALGANVLNMGIATIAVGYVVLRLGAPLSRTGSAGFIAIAFAAGWISVVLTAVLAALELGASGTSPLAVAIPAMVGVHVLIGIGEGLITAAALTFIRATSPGLLPQSAYGGEAAR